MQDRASLLVARLNAIATSLASTDHALALIGLGSVGMALQRLDDYSDLDFFVVVDDDYKPAFIANLTWLADAFPIAFSFRNTRDGHKVLFEDGIYAEFAVFGPTELASIPIDGGRIVWRAKGVNLSPADPVAPVVESETEWLLGELLTNLYVGLTRLQRGEQLSAQRLIQGHAVDRLLELCALIEPVAAGGKDPFDRTRRFERHFPASAQHLPRFIQGYQRSTESALAILDFLDRHFSLNAVMKQLILETAQAVAPHSEGTKARE